MALLDHIFIVEAADLAHVWLDAPIVMVHALILGVQISGRLWRESDRIFVKFNVTGSSVPVCIVYQDLMGCL